MPTQKQHRNVQRPNGGGAKMAAPICPVPCYTTHYYWYWALISLKAKIIGYQILGGLLGIVLTLPVLKVKGLDIYIPPLTGKS